MAEELPIHPFTGLTALGVLPSGRIVWPVIGGASDDGDGGEGGDGDAGDGGGGPGDGLGDGLGDAGKKALEAERSARREAERARKAAETELARLKSAANGGGDGDGKPDAEQIRREAEQAATAKANERILRSEIRAAAAGKLTDPADALAHLNLADFQVGDDGSVDEQHLTDAISDLLKKKPYLAATAQGFQGTGDGGAAGRDNGPKQLTRADIKNMNAEQIEKARREGRLTKVLGG